MREILTQLDELAVDVADAVSGNKTKGKTAMKSSAKKIAEWRKQNPGEIITGSILKELLGVPSLWEADLREANLRGANLWEANLREANLRGANLWGANLQSCKGAAFLNAPSGETYIYSTGENSWGITIGCWENHTLPELKQMIDGEIPFPEARGRERELRLPILKAVYDYAVAQINYWEKTQ